MVVSDPTGLVTVNFATVFQPGNTFFSNIPAVAPGFSPPGYLVRETSLHYSIVTSAPYAGPVTVCIIAFNVDDAEEFARLRILHREGGQLIDRTVHAPNFPAPNFASRQLCARVDNPSEFYIAQGPVFELSGRVTTPAGMGLRNATVVVTDYRGVKRSATTSSFGVYNFAGVRGGETYTVTVSSKRYRFAVRTLVLNSNSADVDFVGLE